MSPEDRRGITRLRRVAREQRSTGRCQPPQQGDEDSSTGAHHPPHDRSCHQPQNTAERTPLRSAHRHARTVPSPPHRGRLDALDAVDAWSSRDDHAAMSSPVLTVVTATVSQDVHERLIVGFHDLLNGGLPEGLLRTELLRGPDDRWRIQTLWRDRAALDAMRAGPEPPAAPTLFRSVGSEPSLEIWDLVSGSPV